MSKALMTLLLGSSLVVLPLSTALGNESTGLKAPAIQAGRRCRFRRCRTSTRFTG